MAINKTDADTFMVDYRDQEGKRRQKTFDTYKEAREYEKRTLGQIQSGEFIAPSGATVKEIAEKWLARKQEAGKTQADGKFKPTYRRSTLAAWKNHIDHHIVSALGKVKIQHLDVERVESAASEWEKATSAKTANKMLTTLTAVMDLALRYKLTRENPAERAERLKVETDEEDGEVVTPDKIYNEAELKKLLKASEKLPLAEGLLVRVPALLGLRIGEVLGLTWGAIDLKEGRLSVRFALADGDKGSGALLQPPKSKSSRRTLVMSDGLRRDFAALKLAAELKGDDDLIFVTPEEKKPFHRKAATKILDRAIIGAGIERRTFHALRHTFASVLLMRGKPPVEVAAKLGHKDPNVTLRVYAHFIRRENEAADLADLEGVG